MLVPGSGSLVKMVVLGGFAATAAYVHCRGRVRHGFARQLTDHSTFLAPVNALFYLCSRVPNRPFLELNDLPELAVLTARWRVIRDEGLRLLDEGFVRAAAGYTDLGFNSFFRTGWKRFYLKWYGEALPSAERLCPETVRLLREVPSIHGAMFALLPPGARLVRHRDPFAGSLRYHLGLSTPNSDDCYIEVDGIRRGWRDGEALIFDETFIHHAENRTDQTRLILFCDVDRPLRGALPRVISRFIVNHVVKATATENVPGDGIGVANRLFAGIYRARLLAKRLKAWDRRVYYGLKYAVVGATLAAIILR
ncbi:aspartyl/asparaginyl beta-hydroxylase domain-containing protein [Acidisphaera rubrifaciens]|uniref:Aspartyl/asparaginyl beta-hydroxylase n=1 Tax=Acidisphaera rubrifaciens HS-AP3 TaxID=1231350 RepID=A0A0D6P7S5_9PROT|nr:aspartyl/asparaginyl beta-hydroxylase domain-containing protein [Acidisphaera rubrifaciens]GAN77820.1 aspartyl/asparaginyl beta-hydroxylase [Acidisphaera rubrifaciens HS-AP3]